METILQLNVALLLLINLHLLGSSRLGSLIRAAAGQAFLLLVLAAVAQEGHFSWHGWLVIGSTIAVKCLVLPALMRRALIRTGIRREVEPLVGYPFSLFCGVVLLVLCLWLARHLPLPAGSGAPLVVAISFFTIAVGLFLIVSRTKAITQAIGYLVMENGISAFGLAVAAGSPFIVEIGVLLDVFVGVFVMGVIILHIKREFDHIDTDQLSILKD